MFRTVLVVCLVLVGASARGSDAMPDYRPVAGWMKLPAGLELGPVSAVAVDSRDRVYVAHRGPKPILVFEADGTFLRSWGDEHLKTVHALRIDPQGKIWVSDIGHHLVMKFDPLGKLELTLGEKGQPGDDNKKFDRPTDIAFAPTGDFYVTDGYGNSRVIRFTSTGRLVKMWGTKGNGKGQFRIPHAITFDSQGRLLVGDRENNRVQVFSADGEFLEEWAESGAPYGLCFAGDRLFVADGRANWVRVLDNAGKPIGRIGEKGAAAGQFLVPHMLTVDSEGSLYVAEVGNKRLQKFTLHDPQSWKGKKVLARNSGSTIVCENLEPAAAESVRHIVYTVVSDLGDRIRVNYPGQEGVAKKADWVLLPEAHGFFSKRIETDPRDAFAWSRRGVANRYAGKSDLALKDLEEAVRLSPTWADLVGIRGMMFWANKDYDRAIADYTEAVRLDPGYAVGLRNRGLAWHAKGEFDKAIVDYSESARVAPYYSPALHDRAATWHAKGDDVKAKEDLLAAIRLSPRNAAALADLARLLATSKDNKVRDGKQAVEIATKANELSEGKDSAMLDALAAAFAETGDFARAIDFQKKALANPAFEKEFGARAKERLASYEQMKPWRE